jgi:hypothetical protein
MLKELSCRRAANIALTWRTEVIHASNLSEQVRKPPEITLLGEENPALAHRDLDDGVIFCPEATSATAATTSCPAARREITA